MEDNHKTAAKYLEDIVADKEHGAMKYIVMINLTEQFLFIKQEPSIEPNKSFYALVKGYLQHKNMDINAFNISRIELPEILEYARKGG